MRKTSLIGAMALSLISPLIAMADGTPPLRIGIEAAYPLRLQDFGRQDNRLRLRHRERPMRRNEGQVPMDRARVRRSYSCS